MASSSHQQGNSHLKFTNSPCFFKIILQDAINNGKLGIPRKFVKEHGHCMSSPAMLRVPSGEVRKVELGKCDGKIWFGKGWLEFASHHSVDMGHLLIFRYDGNSNFHVTIFDRSATEMQYPHTGNQPSEEIPEHVINNSEDVDSLHILHNESPSRKVREKSQLPSPRPHKMMRSTNSAITTETECNENNELLAQQGCAARKDDKSMSHDTIRTKEHESNEAFERARNSFQSENPFFLAVVHPSYVFRLDLPTNFVREHLMKERCCITLCNSSGKTWVVTHKQKYTSKRLLPHLRIGWGTFVHANNIKVGDVCAFELIDSIKISFKVHIYKGQHANCHQPLTSTHVLRRVKREPPSNACRGCRGKPQSPCLWSHRILRSSNTTIKTEFNEQSGCAAQSVRFNEKVKAVARDGNSFKSENQSFLIIMQPTHVGQNNRKVYKLVLPCNFAKKYLMKEHCSVTLCSSGKTWIANIKQKHIGNRIRTYIQAGWGTFVRDNSIQLGDVCSFELINRIQLSFKVVILKGQHEKNCHQSASTDVFRRVKRNAQSCATASPSFPKSLTDLKKASASKSKDPFFAVVVKPSHVNYYRLSIPADFARQYFTKMHKEVILLILNGKSWPVRYYQYGVSIEGPKPNVVLSDGWRRFSVDNNLEVGDVCRFELTKDAETSMNVTITKKQAVEDAKFGSSSDDESGEKQGELHETGSMKEKVGMSNMHNQH